MYKKQLYSLRFSKYKCILLLFIWILQLDFIKCIQCKIRGCQNCVSQSNNLCEQCREGFTLTLEKKCKSSQCTQKQYSQQYTDNSNALQEKCVSICKENEYANDQTNSCDITNQCSNTFIQKSQTNKSRNISFIFQSAKDNLIFLVYDTFVNVIDSNNGSFKRTFLFDDGVSSLNVLDNKLYLLNIAEKKILEWDPYESSSNFISQIQSGDIKPSSQIFKFSNEQRYVISSFDNLNQKLYLSEISMSLPVTISFDIILLPQNPDKIFTYNNFLLQQKSDDYKIKITSIISSEKTVQKLVLNQDYLCNDIKGQIIESIEYIDTNNSPQYFMIFKQTNSIYIFYKEGAYSCLNMPTSNQPKQIKIIQQNPCKTSYLIVKFDNFQLKFYSINKEKLLESFQIKADSEIIDYTAITNLNTILIYLITDANPLFQFLYQEVINFNCQMNQPNNQDIKLNNPQKVILKSPIKFYQFQLQEKNDAYSKGVLLTSLDTQFIIPSIKSTALIVRDFQDKTFKNEATITKILYMEFYHFIVSCSIEGKIVVWKAIDPLQPKYLYSIWRYGQVCLDMQEFKMNYVVVHLNSTSLMFNSEILIFNVFNFQEMKSYPLKTANYAQISVTSKYIYMFYDEQATILNDYDYVVAKSQQSLFPDQFKNIQQVFVPQTDKIIVYTNKMQLTMYEFDISTKVIQEKHSNQFLNSIPIQQIKLFNLDTKGFNIVVYDYNLRGLVGQVQVLDQNLKAFHNFQISIGFVFQISSFQQYYIFNLKLLDNTKINQFTLLFLDINTKEQSYVGKFFIIGQFVQYQLKKNNQDLDTVIGINWLPIQYTSFTAQFMWVPSLNKADVPFAHFTYSPQQTMSTAISDLQSSLILTGYVSGEVRVTPTPPNQRDFDVVFNSLSSNKADAIKFINHSTILEQYFIVTNVINCYSIYTDIIIETIEFKQIKENIQSIQGFFVSEKHSLLIAFISTQLIVRDFSKGKNQYSYEFIQNKDLKSINGFFFDEITEELFIYGDQFAKFTPDLKGIYIINQKDQQLDNFQNCIFVDEIIACNAQSQKLVIYNRSILQFSLITTILATESNFKIVSDIQNKYILIFNKSIQVYSYTGTLIVSISSQINESLLSINYFDNFFVVITKPMAIIFNSQSLKQIGQFVAPGGILLGIYYLKEQKLMAYYSDDLRQGQIMFQNTENFLPAGFIVNTYDQVGIGRVIKIIYDADSKVLNYFDEFGNNQNILMSTKTIDNTFSLEEIQQGKYEKPSDHIIDFRTNTLLVHNGMRVWKINYNFHTRQARQFFNRPTNHYFIIKNTLNSERKFLVSDYKNTLFLYQNFEITFFGQFSKDILDMRQLESKSQKIYMIFYLQQILVFKNYIDLALESSATVIPLKKFTYKKILLAEKDKLILNTVDNQIIDYNYFTNTLIFEDKLDLLDEIITIFVMESLPEQLWVLYYGTESGKVGYYDINNPKNSNRILLNSLPIIRIQQINQNIIACVDIQGTISMLDIKTLIQTQEQLIFDSLKTKTIVESEQLNKQQKVKTNPEQNKKIQIFEVDKKNQRYFVNYYSEKKIEVWSLKDFTFIKHLQFPDDQWQQITQNDQFIILSCSYQLNVYYSDSLKFLNYARRLNRWDRITDLRLIDSNKIIVVFNTRIEILFIIQERNEIKMVDSIPLIDSKLLFLQLDEKENQIILVGVSKENIFEKRLSIGIKEQLIQTRSNTQPNNLSCYSIFKFQNQAQIQNQYDQIYDSIALNIKYLIQVKLYDEIRSLHSINKKNSQIILRPQDSQNNILNIRQNSFVDKNFDLYLDGFNIKFAEQINIIKTNPQSKNIVFQNILIENQSLSKQMSILLDNKDLISFQNIQIKNINLIQTRSTNKPTAGPNIFINILQTKQVYIEHLQLEGINFSFSEGFFLFSATLVDNLYIKELTISNSILDSIFRTIQCKNVTIQNLKIYNSNSTNLNDSYKYIFQFIGVSNIILSKLYIQSNKNIQLFNSLSYFQSEGTIIYLTEDTFQLLESEIIDNTFDDNNSASLIYSESSYINITSLKYFKNQGNIYLKNNKNVIIKNSDFDKNTGTNGGSIQVEDLKNFIIQNTMFTNNKVLASGGAIYLNNIQNFQIDKLSQINKNQALIGGGIRILNKDVNLEQKYIIDCIMLNNSAEIFGNTIGSYLSNIEIYTLKNKTENYKKDININELQREYKGLIQQSNATSIIFNSIKSGGNLLIYIKLADTKGDPIKIDETSFQQNKYHNSVIEELNSFFLEFLPYNSNQPDQNMIDIKGETILTMKQYNFGLQMLVFSSLNIQSAPLAQYVKATIRISFIQINLNSKIDIYINFRECFRGEVLQYTFKNYQTQTQQYHIPIISCQRCQNGTFSLVNPMTELTQTAIKQLYEGNNIVVQTCKKCPATASSCEGDKITLDEGYWREDKYSEEIIQCNEMNSYICNENDKKSLNGCIEGYIGPLCETCDLMGKTWKGKRFTSSLSEKKCHLCSEDSYQISFVTISIICLFLYLFLSTTLFMNRYIYHSTCYYLRLMNILPFSKSCTLDSSSYFIKTLINYLQISTLLFSQNINITPPQLNIIPITTSNPSTQIIVSFECLYGIENLQKFGVERIRAYCIAFFPIALASVLYVILQICSKYKIGQITHFHKYTMLNVVFLFFQPDCIGFFTKALSCRQIGENSYQQINNLILCSDSDYNNFSYYFILPNLVFWSLTPSFIFYQIKKNTGNNYEKLNYCTTKFRYGYFYLEYKERFYYWELVRSYFKISLVLIATLLNNVSFNMKVLYYFILIFLYIINVMTKKPFESQFLNELEITSFLILIPCVFFFLLYYNYKKMELQLVTVIIHYCFLTYIILLILKMKMDNWSNNRFYKLVRGFLLRICPNIFINSVLSQKSHSSQALLKWRFLYRRIKQIKELQNQTNETVNQKTMKSQELLNLQQGRELFNRNKIATSTFYDFQNVNKKKTLMGTQSNIQTFNLLPNDNNIDQQSRDTNTRFDNFQIRIEKSPTKKTMTELIPISDLEVFSPEMKKDIRSHFEFGSQRILSQSLSYLDVGTSLSQHEKSPTDEMIEKKQKDYDFKQMVQQTKFQ